MSLSSPCAWGCFRRDRQRVRRRVALPHVHGGVSPISRKQPTTPYSSPCAWGCFLAGELIKCGICTLPHVHGGVSKTMGLFDRFIGSSPCAWGCFWLVRLCGGQHGLFPMCMGVFLPRSTMAHRISTLPHVHGGVSRSDFAKQGIKFSSPCAWGCFLDTTGRSIAAPALPHVHGGVS